MSKKIISLFISAVLLFASYEIASAFSVFKKIPDDTSWSSHDYTSVMQQGVNLHPVVIHDAVKAYEVALKQGLDKKHILTVIDYSLPSFRKRLWVIDMESKQILFHSLVTHGEGSGGVIPTHFSNIPNSKSSSLGVFLTGNTYIGHLGYSLVLNGLEPGYNDHAASRHVVIHAAWYATPEFAKAHGRAGRSWGCPAIDKRILRPVIDTIKNGTVVFSYYPNKGWLRHSKFLNA